MFCSLSCPPSLGINVLFSGGVDEFAVGLQLNNLLIPALVEALKVVQPLFPYPPDPQVYEGVYTEVTTNSTAQVVTYSNQLVIASPLGNFYLSYWEPLRFQVRQCNLANLGLGGGGTYAQTINCYTLPPLPPPRRFSMTPPSNHAKQHSSLHSGVSGSSLTPRGVPIPHRLALLFQDC